MKTFILICPREIFEAFSELLPWLLFQRCTIFTQVANLSIVKFSFNLSEIAKLSHVFNGEDYITFEVAKLKNPDSFGHGYTAYVNKMVETPEPQASLVEDAPKKSTRKPKRTAAPKTEASIFPDNTSFFYNITNALDP